ncbi:P-loop NTPase fold protein [Sinanaerobacter sp. ZZT-01]|uniref:P-loop NTPase fold protein n=1 Tax=Sinanaerobacter sp. ZZT-01 TaxID=3111540 RepID=UPI002D785ED6|nr:P-loop NTPase fold protein [Sinanaerobacter sp. ZZT-01]WRR93854.1 P-loop NTPase fold protein [Sinanaerobacter sp. ZZT-01]
MNTNQASLALEIIFSDSKIGINEKKCILVDGNWGIGKTYFVQEYFKSFSSDYDLVYTSVFGKESMKDIEKSMLFNLIPGLKNVKDESIGVKVAKTLLNDLGDKFLGVSVENYVNSFSIEDVKWTSPDKRIVICIDDIERKSESIEMKSLLGLIERASRNFDIIVVGNTKEIAECDQEIFSRYKEKVINHIIELNKLDKTILYTIIKNIPKTVDEEDEIINVYLEGNIVFGKPRTSDKGYKVGNIYNLRIFLKYVELIIRVKEHLVANKLGTDILEICKAVIYDIYFPEREGKRKSMNFDKYNIYKSIYKIHSNEDIDKNEFNEYLMAKSEVRADVVKIYNAYTLNEREFDELKEKILMKSQSRDVEYFIKQENVISVFNALNDLYKVDEDFEKSLLKNAVDLYDESQGIHKKIKYSSWDDVDEFGNEIECRDRVKKFIDKINNTCKDKYETSILNQQQEAFTNQEYGRVLSLLKFNELNDKKRFIEIFDYYFNQLVITYSAEGAKSIEDLIDKTESETANDYLIEKKKEEVEFTRRKKIDHFMEYLDRKMEHEARLEYEMEQMINE